MPPKPRKFRSFWAALAVCAALGSAPVRCAEQGVAEQGAVQQGVAQQSAQIETELIAEVRENVSADAQRELYQFVPATLLAQGQVIHYTLKIRNTAAVFARNVVVTQRIPVNTSYIAASASGPDAAISFSIDGGQTFVAPEQLTVLVDGKKQPMPTARYTHIRLQLRNPLAPGAVALARFQAEFR